jgi:glucose-6-phosphate dehydrogenase assembly protein OpcA
MPAVNDTFWAAQNTTPAAIEAALRELLAERHAESAAYVPARVLNLICVVDRQWSGEIANRLRGVGSNHASRTIVCAVSERRTTLDAVATVAADSAPVDGEPALTFETIVIDLGPDHVPHLDSIVDPLVVTDLPTVVWAPHGHWDAVDALRGLSQCVLLDSVEEPEVSVALRRAASLLEDRDVIDLAWLRSTRLHSVRGCARSRASQFATTRYPALRRC